MTDVHVSVEHTLMAQEALTRIKTLLESIKRRVGGNDVKVVEKWNDAKGSFQLTVMGMIVEGRITVSDNDVTLEASLPAMAKPFAGQVEQMIREEVEKVLASA